MCSAASGLRHPASASCLGRHLRLAGRCPNNSSLFPPLAAVVVVATHIQRNDYFYFAFVALCGARQTLFSQRGRNRKRQVQTLPSSPSQALTRQLPQRGSLWRNCTLCNLTGDFPAMPRPLPLGEVASRSDDGEGEPAAPQRRAFAESGAATAVFLYDPSREKVSRENPQIFPGDKL